MSMQSRSSRADGLNDGSRDPTTRTPTGVPAERARVRIERARLPRECVLLFGQEGPGVSADAQSGADLTVSIAQFGSTRSINAGVAAGIAMHAWVGQHADFDEAW